MCTSSDLSYLIKLYKNAELNFAFLLRYVDRTLHCFGWEEEHVSLTDCFPNFTDVGGKHCSLLVLRRRNSLMLTQCQSQHKRLPMWENPNSFLSSSLSINIYLAPFSQFPVCTHVRMHAPCVYGRLRLLSGNHPPLYTKARSQSNTELTNMVSLANQLALGNPTSDFSSWYY